MLVLPSDPEPASFVFGATGNPDGQPGGSCPSSESDAWPSGVATWKLLRLPPDVVVEDDDLFESSLEHPTATAPSGLLSLCPGRRVPPSPEATAKCDGARAQCGRSALSERWSVPETMRRNIGRVLGSRVPGT